MQHQKAKARLEEFENGAYDFVSCSDRITLVSGIGKAERAKLIGADEAQSELNGILDEFFEDLAEGLSPLELYQYLTAIGGF